MQPSSRRSVAASRSFTGQTVSAYFGTFSHFSTKICFLAMSAARNRHDSAGRCAVVFAEATHPTKAALGVWIDISVSWSCTPCFAFVRFACICFVCTPRNNWIPARKQQNHFFLPVIIKIENEFFKPRKLQKPFRFDRKWVVKTDDLASITFEVTSVRWRLRNMYVWRVTSQVARLLYRQKGTSRKEKSALFQSLG